MLAVVPSPGPKDPQEIRTAIEDRYLEKRSPDQRTVGLAEREVAGWG